MKLGRAAPVVLAVVSLAVADRASAQSETGPVHPVIEAYHLTLALLLPEEAITRLEVVETGGTASAPLSVVAYRVADAAVRRFAPLALEAAGRRTEAMQLRRLAPLTDFQRADRAEQLLKRLTDARPAAGQSPLSSAALESLLSARMAARQAMHADRPATPDRILSGAPGARPRLAQDETTAPEAPGTDDAQPANPYGTPEPAYSVSASAEASAMAAREVITAAGAAHDALRAGANPAAVIDASIRSLDDLVRAARRYTPSSPAQRSGPLAPSDGEEPSPEPATEPQPATPPDGVEPPPVVPNVPYETAPPASTQSSYSRSRYRLDRSAPAASRAQRSQ